jgi:hypothetical protein
LDRAVTFAPSGDVVVAALSSLRKGGVVAINAIHPDWIPEFDYDRLLWGERQIRSVADMTRADARDFLSLAAEIQMKPRVSSARSPATSSATDKTGAPDPPPALNAPGADCSVRRSMDRLWGRRSDQKLLRALLTTVQRP